MYLLSCLRYILLCSYMPHPFIMPVSADQHRASVGANNAGRAIALSRHMTTRRVAARETHDDIVVFLFSLVMCIVTLGLWRRRELYSKLWVPPIPMAKGCLYPCKIVISLHIKITCEVFCSCIAVGLNTGHLIACPSYKGPLRCTW